MSVLRLRNIQLGFGGPLLLDGADLVVERGERICLVGRNGEGKSTLLQIIAGEITADDGTIEKSPDIRIAKLQQAVPANLEGTVFDVVAEGLGAIGKLIHDYYDLNHRIAEGGSDSDYNRLGDLQNQIEANNAWELNQQVETILSTLGLDPNLRFEALSGGLKRRVLLARALVSNPHILLLDEPTNHLDIEAIEWLENFLTSFRESIIFVSHDRTFLNKVATRIVDLDRGRLSSWPGTYEEYVVRKNEFLDAQAQQQAKFDKVLAQEEAWIREGIKARRTRNEGRVRALQTMRSERNKRRQMQGQASIKLGDAETSGKRVIEARDISYSVDGKALIKPFSTNILRGDKIGIIGPNGCGKTTLLNILLGKLEPETGSIKLGTNLSVAYFDQMRAQLEEDKSVRDNVGEGSDRVTINGQSQHVMGYLQNFLFRPERAMTPVRALSGGEKNRVLLAKLFTQPVNLLVLDEPTNDLDIETLEVLESILVEYSGTLLLVSHDRQFLDNVVTGSLVFEGDGVVNEYVGGYTDYQHFISRREASLPETEKQEQATNSKTSANKPKSNSKKLSYKDQRELDALPAQIETLEIRVEELQQKLGDPELYKDNPDAVTELTTSLESTQSELEQAYDRWESLEALKDS